MFSDIAPHELKQPVKVTVRRTNKEPVSLNSVSVYNIALKYLHPDTAEKGTTPEQQEFLKQQQLLISRMLQYGEATRELRNKGFIERGQLEKVDHDSLLDFNAEIYSYIEKNKNFQAKLRSIARQ